MRGEEKRSDGRKPGRGPLPVKFTPRGKVPPAQPLTPPPSLLLHARSFSVTEAAETRNPPFCTCNWCNSAAEQKHRVTVITRVNVSAALCEHMQCTESAYVCTESRELGSNAKAFRHQSYLPNYGDTQCRPD